MDIVYLAGSALLGALVGGPLGLLAGLGLFLLLRNVTVKDSESSS